MGDEQYETLVVRLSRPDAGITWGFRLQGGVDFNTPLSVQTVQPNSVAEQCGLQAGDGITKINDVNTNSLTHEKAKLEIMKSCNIKMLVIRGAVQIWKPKVTKMQDLRPQELQPVSMATGDQMFTVQKTSLAKDHVQPNESSNIGSSYNRSAKPFGCGGTSQPQFGEQKKYDEQPPQGGGQQPLSGGGQKLYLQNCGNATESPKQVHPNVVHAQFNSPMGLYSANNIAHTYAQQTSDIQKQMENLDVAVKPLGTRVEGTYDRLKSSDKSQSYGDPTSPSTPLGVTIETVTLESLRELVNKASGSTDCMHPVNGTQSEDHGLSQTNENSNSITTPAGFRSVSAPVFQAPSASTGPKLESMHCSGCGHLVIGVFVRIKGMPYHDKCFKCAKCGIVLKQKGYFQIAGHLYCETHAKMVSEPPGDDLRVAGAEYIWL